MDLSRDLEITSLVAKIPLFSVLSEGDAQFLAASFKPVQLTPGQTLYKAGEEADSLFLIVSGRVRMVALDDEALLCKSKSAHTVRAAEDSSVCRLSRQAFERFLQDKPDFKSLVGSRLAPTVPALEASRREA